MKILVVDVAAQHGGAETVLNQFIDEYNNDGNEYVFVLSNLFYKDTENIRFINIRWSKKSWLHRFWFDKVYINSIIKSENPDRVLSLQNTGFSLNSVTQEVYFHNVLLISDKKYKLSESKSLWIYQNIISRITKKSLKNVSKIYVQAEWIKQLLSKKWNIDIGIIDVKRPRVSNDYYGNRNDKPGCYLFYPANNAIYKNYDVLLKACKEIWDEFGLECGLQLALTCNQEQLPVGNMGLKENKYPIEYLGKLNKQQMRERYLSSVLVFPSVIETVGLPLLEAAQCDCNILAADLEYAHETLGTYERVKYFDPYCVISLKDEIKGLLNAK